MRLGEDGGVLQIRNVECCRRCFFGRIRRHAQERLCTVGNALARAVAVLGCCECQVLGNHCACMNMAHGSLGVAVVMVVEFAASHHTSDSVNINFAGAPPILAL
jgi:hypothetical protein